VPVVHGPPDGEGPGSPVPSAKRNLTRSFEDASLPTPDNSSHSGQDQKLFIHVPGLCLNIVNNAHYLVLTFSITVSFIIILRH